MDVPPGGIKLEPQTPSKSRASGGGFKKYYEKERAVLSVKYPFLSAAQIKNKTAERWKKLSNVERKEFMPSKQRGKKSAKSVQTRIEEARSPGRFFKSRRRDSPYISTPFKKEPFSSEYETPTKTSLADLKFNFSQYSENGFVGKKEAIAQSPLCQGPTPSPGGDGPTQCPRSYGPGGDGPSPSPRCDGKLFGSIYSSSKRRTRSQEYKPPEIVFDDPCPTPSQSGILKSSEKKMPPRARGVSFGENFTKEISDNNFSTCSSSQGTSHSQASTIRLSPAGPEQGHPTPGQGRPTTEQGQAARARKALEYDFEPESTNTEDSGEDSDEERDFQMAGIHGNLVPLDLEMDDTQPQKGTPSKDSTDVPKQKKRKRNNSKKVQKNTLDNYFGQSIKKEVKKESPKVSAKRTPQKRVKKEKDANSTQTPKKITTKKNSTQTPKKNTPKKNSTQTPKKNTPKKKAATPSKESRAPNVEDTPGTKLQKAKQLRGFTTYVPDFDDDFGFGSSGMNKQTVNTPVNSKSHRRSVTFKTTPSPKLSTSGDLPINKDSPDDDVIITSQRTESVMENIKRSMREIAVPEYTLPSVDAWDDDCTQDDGALITREDPESVSSPECPAAITPPESESPAAISPAPSPEKPAKKKRGRKPKDKSTNKASSAKRGRGRPRKSAVKDEEEQSVPTKAAADDNSAEEIPEISDSFPEDHHQKETDIKAEKMSPASFYSSKPRKPVILGTVTVIENKEAARPAKDTSLSEDTTLPVNTPLPEDRPLPGRPHPQDTPLPEETPLPEDSPLVSSSSALIERIRQGMREVTVEPYSLPPIVIDSCSESSQDAWDAPLRLEDDGEEDKDDGSEDGLKLIESSTEPEPSPSGNITGAGVLLRMKKCLENLPVYRYKLPSIIIDDDDSNDNVAEDKEEIFKTPLLPTSNIKKQLKPAVKPARRTPVPPDLTDDDLTTPQTAKSTIEETLKKASKAPRKRRQSQSEMPEEVTKRMNKVRKSLSDVSLTDGPTGESHTGEAVRESQAGGKGQAGGEGQAAGEGQAGQRQRKVQMVKPNVRVHEEATSKDDNAKNDGTKLPSSTVSSSAIGADGEDECSPSADIHVKRASRFLFQNKTKESPPLSGESVSPPLSGEGVSPPLSGEGVSPRATTSSSVLSSILERLRHAASPLMRPQPRISLDLPGMDLPSPGGISGLSTPYIASPAMSGISEISGTSGTGDQGKADSSEGESQGDHHSQLSMRSAAEINAGPLSDLFQEPANYSKRGGRRSLLNTNTTGSADESHGAEDMFF